MIGFLLKKTFYDLWDNLFKIGLVNLGLILSLGLLILIATLMSDLPPPLYLGMMSIGILWCGIYLLAAACCLARISDYGSFGLQDFLCALKTTLPAGLVLGLLVILMFLIITIVIPFYLSMESILGLLLSALLFWTVVAGILAIQFFPAVRARLDTKPRRVLKKCCLFLLDNPLFCLFALFLNILLLPVSVFLAFLCPGPAGMLLFLDEALRLRALKYDWLQEARDTKRRRIPWDILLAEDREKTGHRSFRSFIFPWKD